MNQIQNKNQSLINHFKKQGCNLEITCAQGISWKGVTFTSPTAGTIIKEPDTIQIVFNYEKITNCNEAMKKGVFEHELVHAFDLCKRKALAKNCEEYIMDEVRAYSKAGGYCETKSASEKVDCIIAKVLSNLFASDGSANKGRCKNKSREYVVSYIRNNYKRIIENMPF